MNIKDCSQSPGYMKSYKPHFHDSYEVILQKSGRVDTAIGNTLYHLNEGDIIIIPPHVVHSGKSDGYFSDIYLKTDEFSYDSVIVTHDYDGALLPLMNMLYRTLTEKDALHEQIAASIGDTIHQFICKYTNRAFRYEFVFKLKNRIYQNFKNPTFDLPREIAELGFNPDYLRRCFRDELGKSPLEYLTDLRLSRGKMLLAQDDFASVENVAARCGFSDSFYFSSCFKKHIGLSPLQYRKKLISEKAGVGQHGRD